MLLLIPLGLAIAALVLIILGIVQQFSSSLDKKRTGRINLLIGAVLLTFLISLLIYIGNSFSRA